LLLVQSYAREEEGNRGRGTLRRRDMARRGRGSSTSGAERNRGEESGVSPSGRGWWRSPARRKTARVLDGARLRPETLHTVDLKARAAALGAAPARGGDGPRAQREGHSGGAAPADRKDASAGGGRKRRGEWSSSSGLSRER
jgi:hypothetical protein